MANEPGDYPWSSYGADALGHGDPVVTPHPLYRALHDSDDGRRAAYRSLFADSIFLATLETRDDALLVLETDLALAETLEPVAVCS